METSNFTTFNFTSSTNSTIDFDLISRTCVSSISFLFGLPTHSYVIWLIFKNPSRVASEIYFLNFSFCEIGICLKSLSVVLSLWFSELNLLVQALQGLTVTGRPLFQCLICVERYLAVVHPVIFLKLKPLRYRVICCAVAWIITLVSCVFSILFFIFANIFVHTWSFFLQFLLFLSIQSFCLVSVLRALKQSGPGEKSGKSEDENHMKRRAFHIILITTVSMAVIYVPFMASGFVVIVAHQFIPAVYFTAVFCYVLSGFVPPILFLGRVGKLPLFPRKPKISIVI